MVGWGSAEAAAGIQGFVVDKGTAAWLERISPEANTQELTGV